jgi:hypothetical protein
MASIKCGNCKATHGSAMAVRECYATKGGNTKVGFKSLAPVPAARMAKEDLRSPYETMGVAYQPKPTVTTPRWAKDNMNTDWKAEHAAREHEQEAAAYMAKMERDQDTGNGEFAARSTAPAKPAAVPNGRYALLEDGVVKFYKVNHGKEGGKWAGYVFVDAMASDDLHAIRNRARREAILRAIGADVKGAMALYGVEIGKCGHCGRKLTSEWRKHGIGPVCAEKMGFVR